MIRVISILDEVISLIRASENKSDAKENLKVSYDFSEEQAEAIVTLQLYRLTNTDIVALKMRKPIYVNKLRPWLPSLVMSVPMFNVMKRELRDIKKKFGNDRRSGVASRNQDY